jgi:hypothetical protein
LLLVNSKKRERLAAAAPFFIGNRKSWFSMYASSFID